MKCEVMCADFGIQYIVLNTSYFFLLFFSWKVSKHNLSPKE